MCACSVALCCLRRAAARTERAHHGDRDVRQVDEPVLGESEYSVEHTL